jgi:hypothetical protein
MGQNVVMLPALADRREMPPGEWVWVPRPLPVAAPVPRRAEPEPTPATRRPRNFCREMVAFDSDAIARAAAYLGSG